MLDLEDSIVVDGRARLLQGRGPLSDLLALVDEKSFRQNVQELTAEIASHCDGARTIDYTGFNKRDAYYGRKCAANDTILKREPLTIVRRWAAVCYKYRRQVHGNILDRMFQRRC